MWQAIIDRFEKVAAYRAKKHEEHIAIMQLRKMTDKELADLGISRADIPHVVKS